MSEKSLAPRESFGIAEVEKIADYVVKSGLFGVNRREQAVALMLLSQAEGLHPMKAIQEYHIIQGRPAMRADAMLARFQKAGGRVEWHELTDSKARATFTHPQGGSVTIEWTVQMARQAGLFDKTGSNWKRYPRAMLRARVISEGIRTIFPGVIAGIYTPEEIVDTQGQPDIIDAEVTEPTPESEPEPETEPKEKWTIKKIREVATDDLKDLVKKYKIKTPDLIELFEEFEGNQEEIVKHVEEIMKKNKGNGNGKNYESQNLIEGGKND
ncbi:MAG: recombinase RecT [Candidatus Desulfofervidaceae bacterium]|nr:recombinase RecT [Candidatus Desulfofervidaceae bacterium]